MTLTKDAPLYRCHLPKVIDSPSPLKQGYSMKFLRRLQQPHNFTGGILFLLNEREGSLFNYWVLFNISEVTSRKKHGEGESPAVMTLGKWHL